MTKRRSIRTRASGLRNGIARCGRRWKADFSHQSDCCLLLKAAPNQAPTTFQAAPSGDKVMLFNELTRREGDDVDYQKLVFDYTRHPDQNAATPVRRPVVVVGAGPVGLALAIDLAQREIPVVLLDNDN